MVQAAYTQHLDWSNGGRRGINLAQKQKQLSPNLNKIRIKKQNKTLYYSSLNICKKIS